MEQPAVPCPRPMRRADREVHDTAEIEGILRDCADVRVAYQDAQGLTIMPVNFAYVLEDGKLTLFMHSALAGRKIDAIRSAGNALPVAFEMDCDAEVYTGRTPCSSTTAFRSIIGTGVAAHPGSALSGIVLVAMVPTLSIAAVISRSLYKKTGNIWLPAFLNALLMTTMAVANTMVAFK